MTKGTAHRWVDHASSSAARIRIVGVGGTGCGVIAALRREHSGESALLAVDADAAALPQTLGTQTLRLGAQTLPRLCGRMSPQWSRHAALAAIPLFTQAVHDHDMDLWH